MIEPCQLECQRKVSRTDSEMLVRSNQEFRSKDSIIVMRQIRGQARKSTCRSGVGSGPVITRQVHSDKAGTKISQSIC